MDEQKLMDKAMEASKNSYSVYSKFKVGAALLGESGKIFLGTNIENASYGLTICAERVAFFKAVSCGEKKFIALAIYVDADILFPPCGACRQVIAEFCESEFKIIYFNKNIKVNSTIGELLPHTFSL